MLAAFSGLKIIPGVETQRSREDDLSHLLVDIFGSSCVIAKGCTRSISSLITEIKSMSVEKYVMLTELTILVINSPRGDMRGLQVVGKKV